MTLANRDVAASFLNKDGQFFDFASGTRLLSVGTDGILNMGALNENFNVLKYETIYFNRIALLFAFKDARNVWRVRFRAVITPAHGLLVFKLMNTLRLENGRYVLSEIEKKNTIALIGLEPKSESFSIMCHVWAHKRNEAAGSFYKGSFGWSKRLSEFGISDSLDGTVQPKIGRSFDEKLKKIELQPLSQFMEQRNAPAIAPRYFNLIHNSMHCLNFLNLFIV